MRRLDACLVVLVVSTTVLGCKEGSGQAVAQDDALLERRGEATLAWQVGEDGQTKLAVRSTNGQPVEDASGSLRFIHTSDGKETAVELTRDPATGLLVADGPELDPELTEVRYDLKVDGKDIRGAIHVPDEGTKELVAGAGEGESSGEAKGVHGGAVERVGGVQYEVVADTATGVVRVYPSGAVKAGELRLGQAGASSRVVVLHRIGDGDDVHYAGLVETGADPGKLTLVVKDAGGGVHARLIGYRRAGGLFVGPGASRASYWAKRGWDEEARELRGRGDDGGKDGGKGKVHVCHRPPGNPDNQHTITVGASALAAHLAHGDYEGPCKAGDGKGNSKGDAAGKAKGAAKGNGKGKGKGNASGKGEGKGKGKGH